MYRILLNFDSDETVERDLKSFAPEQCDGSGTELETGRRDLDFTFEDVVQAQHFVGAVLEYSHDNEVEVSIDARTMAPAL